MATQTRVRCDATAAWAALQRHFDMQGRSFDVRTAFAADASRCDAFTLEAPHVYADLSKNLIDGEASRLLLQLAQECGVAAHRDAMFAGEAINTTERRAVKHWLLRAERDAGDADSVAVHETLDRMLAFAERVRA